MKFFSTINTWFTRRAARTWVAHGLICWGASAFLGAAFALTTGWNGLVVQAFASLGLLVFFLVREAGDELEHKAEGEWNDPQWEDKVTYSADQIGDLMGPVFVALASWAAVVSYYLSVYSLLFGYGS